MPTDFSSRDFPNFGDFFRRHAAQLPMAAELLAAFFALTDPTTPTWAKAILAAAIAYVLCPIDAVPDFIPVLGWVDDLSVLSAAITGSARFCITEEHRRRAREVLGID
jgi:uncharacterized membrane protein YkvA (DUF1232 family)